MLYSIIFKKFNFRKWFTSVGRDVYVLFAVVILPIFAWLLIDKVTPHYGTRRYPRNDGKTRQDQNYLLGLLLVYWTDKDRLVSSVRNNLCIDLFIIDIDIATYEGEGVNKKKLFKLAGNICQLTFIIWTHHPQKRTFD